MRRLLWVGFCLLGLALPGCGLTLPRLDAPGYLYQQQLRATFHDPYAATDVAPEVVGGRPRMFAQPRSPEAQSQWQLDQ